MKIKNFELNKPTKDEFARISGILALNKRAGITSHDLVDEVRGKLNTKKVGHAGTLDPFATGLMIILIGKATKLSNQLLTQDKTYIFDVLFGISTDTQDPEGTVTGVNGIDGIDEGKLVKILKSFEGEQRQVSPVFSSVKVGGVRLRELARGSERFVKEGNTVTFYLKNGTTKKLELPKRNITIHKIQLNQLSPTTPKDIPIKNKLIRPDMQFMVANITAEVSKGTYIRQLAEEIGAKLGVPAMLLTLERTAVGEITLDDIIELNSF